MFELRNEKFDPKELLPTIFRIELELSKTDQSQVSLYGGSIGIALFYAHLFLATQDEQYLEKLYEITNGAIERLDTSEMPYALAGGVAGVAWGLNYLIKKEFFSADVNELFEEIDDYIYLQALNDLNRSNLDLLHGGLGPILFALERLPKDNAYAFITSAVTALINGQYSDDGGNHWRWWGVNGELQTNFGLSHGIPAIIMMLLKVFQKSIMTTEVRLLVNNTLEWMIGHKNTSGEISLYPACYAHKPRYNERRHSRMSWCYGDLTIALTFWKAGQVLNEERWRAEGLRIMTHSYERIDPLDDKNIDAGICHGTAGISHLFKTFAKLTGDDKYLNRSHFWMIETLRLAKFDDTISGYKRNLHGNWYPCSYFLEGTAGIGLTMLGFISEDTAWDECLLLS